MAHVVLGSLRYGDIYKTVGELSDHGGTTKSAYELLQTFLYLLSGVIEETGRDLNKVTAFRTPTLEEIRDAATGFHANYDETWEMYRMAVASRQFNTRALGLFEYDAQTNAQAACTFMFDISRRIQGLPTVPGLAERQRRSQNFLGSFYRYRGTVTPAMVIPQCDEVVTAAKLEATRLQLDAQRLVMQKRLGKVFLTQLLYIRTLGLDPQKLELAAWAKYGVPDKDGNCTCTWCSMVACMDGCRWSGHKFRRPATLKLIRAGLGLPEMDWFMWLAYGASRNTAFSFHTGILRAFTEFAGEFMFLVALHDCGGSLEELRRRRVGIYGEDSRVVRQWLAAQAAGHKRGLSDQQILEECLLAEAGDVLAWIVLMFQTFGWNSVEGIMEALREMGVEAGVGLHLPSDLTRTAPTLH